MSGWVSPPPTLHQVRSQLVHWWVVMGAGRWVGRMGTHIPSRVDGALSRCRNLGRGACAAGALFRTSVFEMGGACFKEPGPVTFASGGVGTDFTRRCDQDGRLRLFSTGALYWTGFGLLANTVEEYVLLRDDHPSLPVQSRGHWGGRATRKMPRTREGTIATFCCKATFSKAM